MKMLLPSVRPSMDIGFLSSSSIVFAGSFVVNVLNYVFTLVMGRMMGIEAFGEVAALLSLYIVVSVPAAALSMLMTREVAFHNESGTAIEHFFLFLRKHVLFAALGLWLIFVALVPLLSAFLHIPYVIFFAFSMLIPLMAVGSLQSGALQGLQEFFMLSKQSVLGALIKLAVSVLFVWLGFSVLGVMFALVLAQCAGTVYGFLAIRKTLDAKECAGTPFVIDAHAIRTLFTTILISTLFLALLSNIDVLLAKHYLPAVLAGQYGALSTLGKIIIYGIGAFSTVLLPMVAAAHARGKGEEKRILTFSLAVIAAASMSGVVIFSFFPAFFVHMLFGARYLDIAQYLGIFSVAMSCVALATALINYFIAIRNTSFLYFLAFGIMLEVLLISLDHSSLAAIAHMLALSSAVLLALMVINFFISNKRRTI